jgi:putative transcriptional regulator
LAQVTNRLRILVAEKETREGRTITYRDIHEATGIAESTLASYMKNEVGRFDAKTIALLCDFLDCTPGELLDYSPEEGHENLAVAFAK